MVGKAPGFVPCAHCGEPGAAGECAACRKMVCPACAADPDTCAVVHGIELDYGDHILYAVDGGGRYGLVGRRPSFWQRIFGAQPRSGIFALAEGVWLTAEEMDVREGLPRHIRQPRFAPWKVAGGPWLSAPNMAGESGMLRHVTRNGGAVWGRPAADTTIQQLTYYDPVEGARECLTVPVETRALRDDGGVWYIADNLFCRYDVIGGALERVPGLPQRIAVQAADYDPVSQLLAIGTWGKLYTFHTDDKVRPHASFDIGSMDVAALRFRAGQIVLASAELGPYLHRFEVGHSIDRRAALEPLAPRRFDFMCDISEDGRWIAVAGRGGAWTLFDNATGEATRVERHHAQLTVLQFTDGDAGIISADLDGRVVIQPRDGDAWCELVLSRARPAGKAG